MIYDPVLGRGLREKCLHEPNPTRVQMKKECSYGDVLAMAGSLFFEAYNPNVDKLSLADSNGMPIKVATPDEWTLGMFYQNNGLQPGRYKLGFPRKKSKFIKFEFEQLYMLTYLKKEFTSNFTS